jgi:hypothetical protein
MSVGLARHVAYLPPVMTRIGTGTCIEVTDQRSPVDSAAVGRWLILIPETFKYV